MNSYSSPTTKPLYRAIQIIWYVLGLIEALLLFRLILKFLGANPDTVFSSAIYNMTHPFVYPFLQVFRTTYIRDSVFEWTTLLAMLVYSLMAWGIINLLLIGKTVSTPEAASKLRDQEK